MGDCIDLKLSDSDGRTRAVSTMSGRLLLSSRLFDYFVMLKRRHGIDIEAYQILSAFKLAGFAELSKSAGGGVGFKQEQFVAQLSVMAISEMTGIPRETVRRKLLRLEESKLLSRRSDGIYEMSSYHSELDIICLIEPFLNER